MWELQLFKVLCRSSSALTSDPPYTAMSEPFVLIPVLRRRCCSSSVGSVLYSRSLEPFPVVTPSPRHASCPVLAFIRPSNARPSWSCSHMPCDRQLSLLLCGYNQRQGTVGWVRKGMMGHGHAEKGKLAARNLVCFQHEVTELRT